MDTRLTCCVCGTLALGLLCEHLEPLLAHEYPKAQAHPVHETHGVAGLFVTPAGITSSASSGAVRIRTL